MGGGWAVRLGGGVAVWLCGGVAGWICGCVAVWLCGCVAVWLCGCVAGCESWLLIHKPTHSISPQIISSSLKPFIVFCF